MNLTNSISKIKSIFLKELRYYFLSPIAYIVIVIFLLVMGIVFFRDFFLANQLEMRSFFSILPIVLAFIIPAITMGVFSSEFSTGSYEIISTQPIRLEEIIIGKFLAATAFMSLALLPTLSYPITLMFLGELDFGPIVGGYISSLFLIASLSSIGVLASSIARDQIISLIIGLAIMITLTLLLRFSTPILPGVLSNVAEGVSLDYHFYNVARGIVDLRDILYFIAVVTISLYGTKLILENRK